MGNAQDKEIQQLSLLLSDEVNSSDCQSESKHELREAFSITDDEERRSNIERIIKSYRHPWDIYGELIQNSVDAIFQAKEILHANSPRWKGKIKITVNSKKRSIEIEDNGIGIPPDKIGQVIVFGRSLKRPGQQSKYGFMGFGLTFVAFQSSYLKIESSYIESGKNKGKKSQRSYRNLYSYIFKKEDLPDAENKTDIEDVKDHGTKIDVQFPIDEDAFQDRQLDIDKLFYYCANLKLFEYILRTKTAIGNTDHLFGKQPICDIIITVDTTETTLNIPFKYLDISEILEKGLKEKKDRFKSIFDYQQLIELTKSHPKAQQLQSRRVPAIWYATENPVEIGERPPIKVDYYIFATSQERIKRYNREVLKLHNGDVECLSNGVFLSLDGMPSSIRLDSWPDFYYSQFTIIVDAKSIKKDLEAGRKGISNYRKKQLLEKAEQLLLEKNFIKYRGYIEDIIKPTENNHNCKDQMIRDVIEKKRRIMTKKANGIFRISEQIELSQQWFPPIEEQEVIALFMELIGKKRLQGYYLQKISTNDQYDAIFEYKLKYYEGLKEPDSPAYHEVDRPLGIKKEKFLEEIDNEIYHEKLIVEFKKTLNSIYKDIHDKKKDLRDIDLLVCWAGDSQTIYDETGDELLEIDISQRDLDGITHQLWSVDARKNIPVICLKTFLEKSEGLIID